MTANLKPSFLDLLSIIMRKISEKKKQGELQYKNFLAWKTLNGFVIKKSEILIKVYGIMF